MRTLSDAERAAYAENEHRIAQDQVEGRERRIAQMREIFKLIAAASKDNEIVTLAQRGLRI